VDVTNLEPALRDLRNLQADLDGHSTQNSLNSPSLRSLRTLRSHQLDCVAETLKLASPVVSTTAGLHADQTRRQVHEKRGHLVALGLLL
jgi:hypothetical protein